MAGSSRLLATSVDFADTCEGLLGDPLGLHCETCWPPAAGVGLVLWVSQPQPFVSTTQDPCQPPAGLSPFPGCLLLAVPAASLPPKPLQLLGHPGVLQGGSAHHPGELCSCCLL